MNIKRNLILSFLFLNLFSNSQNFTGVYKIDKLLKRILHPDTTYVVNFWATWCKPCVQELPEFDSLSAMYASTKVKVLLVNLDFSEELDKKVKPFLIKKGIQTECILLDEVNGNDFVNKISPSWSGAIPATLFKKGKTKHLIEKKMTFNELLKNLKDLN